MKKELSRRSGVQITAELMKLLGGRLSAVMLLAVLNGSLGFLCAMGVPFFGAASARGAVSGDRPAAQLRAGIHRGRGEGAHKEIEMEKRR